MERVMLFVCVLAKVAASTGCFWPLGPETIAQEGSITYVLAETKTLYFLIGTNSGTPSRASLPEFFFQDGGKSQFGEKVISASIPLSFSGVSHLKEGCIFMWGIARILNELTRRRWQ